MFLCEDFGEAIRGAGISHWPVPVAMWMSQKRLTARRQGSLRLVGSRRDFEVEILVRIGRP